jgi:hypothetical protein
MERIQERIEEGNSGRCGTETTFCNWKVANEFLDALDQGTEGFTFQTYSDDKSLKRIDINCIGIAPGDVAPKGARVKKTEVDPNAKVHNSALTDSLCERLDRQNQKGVGVFVTVNETDLKGRKRDNFRKVRAVWADFDHGLPDTFPLSPSALVNSSPGRYHAYWFIGDEMPLNVWRGVMVGIVRNYGGDASVTDPTRVMRLPGTCHMKTGKPHFVAITESARDADGFMQVYSAATIIKAFPPVEIVTRAKAINFKMRPSTTEDAERVASALDYIADLPSEDDPRQSIVRNRASWFRVLCALKHEYDDAGLPIALDWSKQCTEVYDEDNACAVWTSIKDDTYGGKPFTVGSIIHWATKAGWVRPGGVLVVDDDEGDKEAVEATDEPTSVTWKHMSGNRPDGGSTENIRLWLKARKITPTFNEFDENVYLVRRGKNERFDDVVSNCLFIEMRDDNLRASELLLRGTVGSIAQENREHPVRDYFNGLKWDRVSRLNQMLSTYAKAENTRHNQLVGSKWMIASVRRIRTPGCKFDTCLVFEGPQNAGKSSFFRTLASVIPGVELFTDGVNIGDGSKETIELTGGKLIVEAAELSGLSVRDVNQVKQSLSKQIDQARKAFGRSTSEVKRQFVFCGTTNDPTYLKDKTGNRRFWCVTVGKKIDLMALAHDRDQLWAEAAHREKQGEPIYLKDEEYDLAVAEQAKREEDDPLEMQVEELLSEYSHGRIWKTDLFKVLGFGKAEKGGAAIGKRLGQIMAKLGWHDDRGSRTEGQRRCFTKAPVVDDGCEAAPPQRTLKLKQINEHNYILQ